MTGVMIKKSTSPDKSYFSSPTFLLNTSSITRNRIYSLSLRKIVKKIDRLRYHIKKTFGLIKNYLKDKLTIDNITIDESHKLVFRKNSTDITRSNEPHIYHSSLSAPPSSENDSFLSAIQFKFNELLNRSPIYSDVSDHIYEEIDSPHSNKRISEIDISSHSEKKLGTENPPIYENINHSLFFKSLSTGRLLLTPSNKQRIYKEKIMDSSVKPHAFFSKNNALQRLHDESNINLSPRSL